MADLDQDPAGFFGRMIERFVKGSACMCPTSGQEDRVTFGSPLPGEAIVSAVAIALDRTAKIDRNEFLQTLRLSGRVPLKEHVLTTPVCNPKITLPGLSVSRIEIFDRCFINLVVGPAHHLLFDLPVNRL